MIAPRSAVPLANDPAHPPTERDTRAYVSASIGGYVRIADQILRLEPGAPRLVSGLTERQTAEVKARRLRWDGEQRAWARMEVAS